MFTTCRLLQFLLLSADLLALDDSQQEQPIVRLLPDITPHFYSIHLTTNVHTQTNFEFQGDVNITFTTTKAATSILLHSKDLTILHVSLWPSNKIIAMSHSAEHDYLDQLEVLYIIVYTIEGGALQPGVEYTLRLQYLGELNDDHFGFYRTSYINEQGDLRWLATTHFQSINARFAFPCFDEPALRAKFSLRITHGSDYNALSNMPVADVSISSIDGSLSTTTFQTTPSMPTYLLAFTVSDYICTPEARYMDHSVPQRVCTRPASIASTQFALNTGMLVLATYEQYFGMAYELPKLDQLALLGFPMGGMENWGLVSYHEDIVLYTDDKSTFEHKLRAMRIIAHEYAHQWFGNHVTPRWWSYIWLSEGLSTLFESMATDSIYPEWEMLDDFVFTRLQQVMVYDVSTRATAMTKNVRLMEEMETMVLFDDIQYGKAACVLRMFQHALTERVFQAGVILYLEKLKHSSAIELDLFESLDDSYRRSKEIPDNFNVTTAMSSWSQQIGFPLLIVTRDYSTGEVLLEQQPYTANYIKYHQEAANHTWWIPCNYASESWHDYNNTASEFWLNTSHTAIYPPDSRLKSTDWLLFNKRQTGYYRVQYDAENYELLSEGLQDCRRCFHVTNRAQLVDDAFDLARSGRLTYDIPLEMISFLPQELEYLPWAAAFRGLELVDRLVGHHDWFAAFEEYISSIIDNIFSKVGIFAARIDSMSAKRARNLIIHWACRYGNDACLHETNEALAANLTNSLELHQDHESAIICGALVRNGSQYLFNGVYRRLRRTRDSEQRKRLINGLTCSRVPKYLDALLGDSIDKTLIWTNAAERFSVWQRIMRQGRSATALAMHFIIENWEATSQMYSQQHEIAVEMATMVGSLKHLKLYHQFISVVRKHLPPDTVRLASNLYQANYKWIERNTPLIHDWVVFYFI